MKQKVAEEKLSIKEYPVVKNILYCLKTTYTCYPLLLLWCALAILINVLLPVLTTYLPKAVIEQITMHDRIQTLVLTILAFMLSIAVLSGGKLFFEKYIYHQKYRMNTFYLCNVAHKGLTTDYYNQEDEEFRKLQNESFLSCNGNFSPLTRIYDVLIALCSNAFGFLVFFGILAD